MSQARMAIAVRNKIRAVLGAPPFKIGAASIKICPDGRPDPRAGEWFIAIHQGSWGGHASGDTDLTETIGIDVTVTRRLGIFPQDRVGEEAWAAATVGIDDALRLIVRAIHMQYDVMNAANDLIGYPGFCGFEEPLRFIDGGKSFPVGPEWFSADDEGGGRYVNEGVAQTLVFDQAKRMQGVNAYTATENYETS